MGFGSYAGGLEFRTHPASKPLRPFWWRPERVRYPDRLIRLHASAEQWVCGDFALAYSFEKGIFQVVAPYWVWIALVWFWPGVSAFGWWRRRRRRRYRPQHGLCAHCAYDLRAHKPGEKCPECGTVIPDGS